MLHQCHWANAHATASAGLGPCFSPQSLFDEGSFVCSHVCSHCSHFVCSHSLTLVCSLDGFTALVLKYLAAGMAPMAWSPSKDHLDIPVHQAGSYEWRTQYISLPVRLQLGFHHWFVSSLAVPHSPAKTRKQAECGNKGNKAGSCTLHLPPH